MMQKVVLLLIAIALVITCLNVLCLRIDAIQLREDVEQLQFKENPNA